MENASRALIIAGSVLISLLIISLLVAFYGNIRDIISTEEDIDTSEKALEFNKQYEAYYRNNLYGSEILSLCNKVADYNTKYEDDGYSELEIEITFKKDVITYDNKKIIKNGEKCSSEVLKQKIEDLENQITAYGNERVNGRTIQSISGLRTNQLQEMLGIEDTSSIQAKISLYVSYKSALTTIKSKTFNATKFEYNKNNGRIKLMQFQEN